MTEIAKLTHVSQPTVSRVLNGHKYVAPEIRERVLACAKAHDYQFNALAKGLQGSRTYLLGVILSDISNGFFVDLEREIEAKARESGYSIILFNSDLDPMRQSQCLDVVRRYRVDGVLITPILTDKALWQECINKLDIPTVVITQRVEGLDSVYLDHEEAAGQVARHMAEKAYKRFLFIGSPDDSKYAGFVRELEALGLCPARQVGQIPCADNDRLRRDLENYFRRSGPRVGVFAFNDMCALRVLQTLRDMNIRVPEEAGVIGFDDIPVNRYLQPTLSSVSQPIAQMAEEAIARLFSRIDHPHETGFLDRPFQATLISREST